MNLNDLNGAAGLYYDCSESSYLIGDDEPKHCNSSPD